MKVLKNENVNKKQPVNENTQQEKLSYEELENIAHQLSDQSKTLVHKLQQANMDNVVKRLEYLFKVIEYNSVFPADFYKECIAEVVDLISIPKDTEEVTTND